MCLYFSRWGVLVGNFLMNIVVNIRKVLVYCVIVMGVLNLLFWWRLMILEEIEIFKGFFLELIIVLKLIYLLF